VTWQLVEWNIKFSDEVEAIIGAAMGKECDIPGCNCDAWVEETPAAGRMMVTIFAGTAEFPMTTYGVYRRLGRCRATSIRVRSAKNLDLEPTGGNTVPLRIVPNGQRDVPTIVCDHCGRAITNVKDGNYQFRLGEGEKRGEGSLVYFTHKACCHAFDRMHPAGGADAGELDSLFVYLANNLKLDWEEARARAALLDSIE
jgi:hypothetical protein